MVCFHNIAVIISDGLKLNHQKLTFYYDVNMQYIIKI